MEYDLNQDSYISRVCKITKQWDNYLHSMCRKISNPEVREDTYFALKHTLISTILENSFYSDKILKERLNKCARRERYLNSLWFGKREDLLISKIDGSSEFEPCYDSTHYRHWLSEQPMPSDIKDPLSKQEEWVKEYMEDNDIAPSKRSVISYATYQDFFKWLYSTGKVDKEHYEFMKKSLPKLSQQPKLRKTISIFA